VRHRERRQGRRQTWGAVSGGIDTQFACDLLLIADSRHTSCAGEHLGNAGQAHANVGNVLHADSSRKACSTLSAKRCLVRADPQVSHACVCLMPYLCDQNGCLGIPCPVELQHLLQGVVAHNITAGGATEGKSATVSAQHMLASVPCIVGQCCCCQYFLPATYLGRAGAM
jgi:hypothetical protein